MSKCSERLRYARTRIYNRPAEADGKRFEDWEIDLIIGKGQKSIILILCEHSKTTFLMARLPEGKNSDKVADMAIRLLFPYRKNVLTITMDNGTEFTCHKKIAKALDTIVYFTDSYASWQKWAIENESKIIRLYIPKGTGSRELSEVFIKEVQYKINRRPRGKLNFSTPKNEFFKFIS